jgi:hypothetical protein
VEKELVKAEYEYVNREANCVAHELACLAKFSSPAVWLDDPLLSYLDI